MRRPSYVYLAETTRREFLKIGATGNPKQRLSGLGAHLFSAFGVTDKFRIVGLCEGGRKQEAEMLKAASCLYPPVGKKREWFQWSAPLVDSLRPSFPMPPERVRGLCRHGGFQCNSCRREWIMENDCIILSKYSYRWAHPHMRCMGCQGPLVRGEAYYRSRYLCLHEWCMYGYASAEEFVKSGHHPAKW